MKSLVLTVACLGCVSGTGGPGDPGSPVGATAGDNTIAPPTVQLTVALTGPGRVTSTPAGIDCASGGGACSATLAGEVTLHASADATVRWGGECAGNGDCSLGTTGSHAVTAATFAPIVRTFDGEDHRDDACHAVATGPDGSFVVTGETQRLAEGRNAWARKYDATGAVLWTDELHTPSEGSDAGNGVVVLPDGAAVIAGNWYSGSDTTTNNFLARLDGATPAWTEHGELTGNDQYRGVSADGGGGLIVAGSLGAQAWVRGIAGDPATETWSITRGTDATAAKAVVATNGDVLAVGSDAGHGWIARYRAGAEVWADATAGDRVDDIAAIPGGFAVVGSTSGAGWLRVYDDTGAIAWSTPAEAGWSWSAVAVRPDGGVVVAGTHADAAVVRAYGGDGAPAWDRSVAGAAGAGVAVAPSGTVVMCGTQRVGAQNDALAIAYPQ